MTTGAYLRFSTVRQTVDDILIHVIAVIDVGAL